MMKHRAKNSVEDRAQGLRRMGVGFEIIAYALDISASTAHAMAKDVKPEWLYVKKKDVEKPSTEPVDDVLTRRARNLVRRGFDVPPSKQSDWENLQRAAIPVDERKRMLNLE